MKPIPSNGELVNERARVLFTFQSKQSDINADISEGVLDTFFFVSDGQKLFCI